MTQETAAQNIKNLLKSSIENQKIEELKRKQCTANLPDLARPSVDKESLRCRSVAQG
jgi:hypothetical protein